MRTPAPLDPDEVERVLRPFGASRGLPAPAYRSQAVFDWEAEEVFGGGWICLGRTDDLLGPGQLRAVGYGAESLLLARSAALVRGYSNVCRHRGHLLLEPGEAVDARLIRCPYHSWSYRFDGSLRSAPTLSRSPGFEPGDWPLAEVRVGDYLGWLFVDLSGSAPSLDGTFGNLAGLLAPYQPARLVRQARHTYQVAANWKLLVENYHECYHCTSIHPALCELTAVDSGRDIAPTGLWCGGSMVLKEGVGTMSLDGSSPGPRFPGLAGEQARQVLYLGLWPNLLVSPHPDYVMTHRLVPVAPDRTLVECDWLFAPEVAEAEGFDAAYAVEFWDLTNREDWRACEQVQLGTGQRGYAPGPLSPWESTIYQFLTMLATAYQGKELAPPMLPESHRRSDPPPPEPGFLPSSAAL
jgi:Rieske 2Fe-2S family protein